MILDAHIHYADDDPAFLALLAEFGLKLFNICVAHEPGRAWRDQADLYRDMTQAHPQRFAWCTSFDLPTPADPAFDAQAWADRVCAGLDADFAAGALACKVWKNVGMEVRHADGSFLMPDDPLLDPVYAHLAARGWPLLTHIAEPLACWQPLDPANPHHNYYRDNPQWHMFHRPDYPSHGQLIAARDNLLAKHPDLRVIGAHLGSLEYDVDEVAARLDRYPNFAVDISARLGDLAVQPAAKVRDFLTRYNGRVLFGTDVVMRTRPSQLAPDARASALAQLRSRYATHFAYFTTSASVQVGAFISTGLDLPADVLDVFLGDAARAWYPGL